MDVLTIDTLDALKAYLNAIDRPMLYRGQTGHYGGTDAPAISTSFDRHGCVPSEMLKWSRYARGALKYALGEAVDALEISQAILQHYGWRSFYLDASSSAAVGAWFASHSYSQNIAVHLSEDCFENPMFLRKPEAKYDFEEGTGHLYLVDPTAAAHAGVELHDLSSIAIANGRARFHAQAAWLLGPQTGALPPDAFHARLIAPRAVFAAYAAEAGLVETNSLFPPPSEDIVLSSLLHLPWTEIRIDGKVAPPGEIPAFRRSIEIPEYEDGFAKRYDPTHAFYRDTMFADHNPGEVDEGAPVFREVPDIAIFGTANPLAQGFPEIAALLQANPHIAFEVRQLFRFPETGPSVEYGKGVVIRRLVNGLIAVGDLSVDHPGMQLAAAGTNAGWHYEIGADGSWFRVPHVEDCPCGDDDRHLRHLSVLTIINHFLANEDEFEN